DQKAFAFGSEIKSLIQNSYVASHISINKKAVSQFLYLGYIPEPVTIYKNIFKLPAGSIAIIKGNNLQIEFYWKVEDKIHVTADNDFGKAKKKLNELLLSSVKYRMISDVPFGTFLSGGIDSSLVTAMAQHHSSVPVKTFSIGFKEASHNESHFAASVAKHLGTSHTEFIVSERDAMELTERIFITYDEPFADSSSFPTLLVSKLARQHVTMVLTGDGGDELFLGYGAYIWARRLNHILIKLLRKPLSLALAQGSAKFKRGAGVLNYPSEKSMRSHIFSQEQYFFSLQELKEILYPDYFDDINIQENFDTKRKLSSAEAQALFDIKYYLKDDLLVKVDRASMQYSLEARTPFLDYRVVEFAINLHEDLKLRNGTSKYLLKEILYDYIPKQLFERPKWGFAIPLSKWMKKDLNYIISDWLSQENIQTEGVVRLKPVQSLIKRFEAGEDYLYNRIYVLALLHKWLKFYAHAK
ncbi:MAG: asparagine synthase (glutamine-hydrolyzing), partial [Chitinophagales bacterium]|nr:asparagine synthase (glutamine-hydrolyzing) [Chitinophagales bacterium]